MSSVTDQLIMRIALIDAVTKPLQGINNQLQQVKRTAQSGFASVGGGGAAMLAGGLAIQNALMPAIEMDRALGEVASLDVAQDGLKALSNEALKFSVEYGKSATEFVRASYDIQSAIAGLEGNELPAFTRASAVLAAATKADTGTITSYMGTMYGIFEQQAKQMGKATWVEAVAGKTATAVQMFKTTGQGMADAFKGIGANATAAGISMDEQFAVLGMLQASGSGSEAGTQFSAFLSGVGKAQKKLGMQFTDSAGKMLPVLTILEKLKARYGETIEVAEGDALKEAFGSELAVKMINSLITKTEGLSTNINEIANTHGMSKAEQMAAAMTDQWERVGAAWFAIRAAAFGAVLPAINKVVGAFADGGAKILRWTRLFPHLTKVVSYAILAIAGLGMVTGAWLMLAGVAKLVTLAWALSLGKLFRLATLTWLKTKLLTIATWAWKSVVIVAKVVAFAFTASLWLLKVALSATVWALGIAKWVVWNTLIGLSRVAVLAFNGALILIRGTLAAFRAVMLGVNAVMLANPIILIVLGVVALIGAIALGIYYWDEIKAAMADWGVFDALGGVFDGLSEKWQSFMQFLRELTPFKLVGRMINWLVDMINRFSAFSGMSISTKGLEMPDHALPSPESVGAPLAAYRQQTQSKVPVGGIGQQLIQANAAATSAHQKPSRTLHINEVNITSQNPITPEELEKNAWVEQRG